MAKYTTEFKEAAVQKLLAPGSPGINPLARKLNLTPRTLRNWRDRYVKGEPVGRKQNKGWTAEQKLRAVMETSGMDELEIGVYCRKNGMFSSQLEMWREQCLASMRMGPKVDPAKRALEHENKALKKELHRKEKALAEAAALLVLKKKAEAYWGVEDEGVS